MLYRSQVDRSSSPIPAEGRRGKLAAEGPNNCDAPSQSIRRHGFPCCAMSRATDGKHYGIWHREQEEWGTGSGNVDASRSEPKLRYYFPRLFILQKQDASRWVKPAEGAISAGCPWIARPAWNQAPCLGPSGTRPSSLPAALLKALLC